MPTKSIKDVARLFCAFYVYDKYQGYHQGFFEGDPASSAAVMFKMSRWFHWSETGFSTLDPPTSSTLMYISDSTGAFSK